MRVTSYSITDIGKQRQLNQDYVFTSQVPMGTLPNLFIVADGMGGHKAGEYASKCAVETIVDDVNLSTEKSVIKVLSGAIRHANERIRQVSSQDDNYQGMGTTLVVAAFDGKEMYVANVGDSRLYLLHDGLRQVTTDHSLVEEMVRIGELEREKARNHPDKNIITRAIGVVEVVDVDFFELDDLKEGDIILMCSDGLSNMLDDNELERIVGGAGTLEEKAKRLIAAANLNGGRDNIAVILIELLLDEE
ncbi:MAG TPA: Stp1/IreP family PP2C-type Ser/Thr phosphatase [Lachnospiraceae bacterium]|nr:Stp1/IreP family PP2C-type Ser/Thr phosphatase [Lachnospiraceae bacterium]HPF29067.1 Stp1/IreP family PP2C-type Ser/Thr phosphatase [Lachnospiraceae bacterium]